MKKVSNENLPESPDIQVMSDEEEAEEFEGIEEGQATILRASLKAASEGISKGIASDMASTRAADSILGDVAELLLAPLQLSTPGRLLERGIKGARGLTRTNEEVNSGAVKRLQEWVVQPGLALYSSNFDAFIRVMEKLSERNAAIREGLAEPNDIANIEAMAIDLKGRSLSTPVMSQNSHYKSIIKQVIPILREKFDAVASFDEALGAGAKVDYEGIAQDLYEGMDEPEDLQDLVRFYRAIKEWRDILSVFSSGATSMQGAANKQSEGSKEKASEESEAEEDRQEGASEVPEKALAKDIYIHSLRPGQYTTIDPNGSGSIYIDLRRLGDLDVPVIKLFIKGDDSDKVNSEAASGEQYFEHFVNKGHIVVREEFDGLVRNITRESVSMGSELSLYLDKQILLSGSQSSGIKRSEALQVRSQKGALHVFVDDVSQVRNLKRVASAVTTSYYQAKSPSGEWVSYTPTDLVIGGGKLKDSKGNKFKPPAKSRGMSLAKKVQSKGFGKVRKK